MILRHITTKSGTSTLETLNGKERRMLPAYVVTRLSADRCEVDDETWQRGVILDLELTEFVISVVELKAALHKRGLWTMADLEARPADARAALVDACGDVVKRIIEGGHLDG